MAISSTVIEDCASLGTCLQLESMISLSFLGTFFIYFHLQHSPNVSDIKSIVNIVRHYRLDYILCFSVEKLEYLSSCHILWLGVIAIAYRLFCIALYSSDCLDYF